MSVFGQILFGGSRFIRWALSPFVLLFAAVMPLIVEHWTLKIVVMIAGMEFLCVALLAGFWLPPSLGQWAFRSVAAGVFLSYGGYLICEFFFSEAPFRLVEARGEASSRNALFGFVIIGFPCLCYALFGRFTFRKPEPEPPDVDSDDEAKGDEAT